MHAAMMNKKLRRLFFFWANRFSISGTSSNDSLSLFRDMRANPDNLSSPIVALNQVFNLLKFEKDLSALAVVTG